MSAPDFLSNAFRSTVDSLGGHESVVIDSQTFPAVLDPTIEAEDLSLGGEGDERSLALLIPSVLLDDIPQKGDLVTCRAQDWVIHQVDHHPFTSTRLLLQSPARRTF